MVKHGCPGHLSFHISEAKNSFCVTRKTAAEGDCNWQDLQCQGLVGSVENSQADALIKGAAVTQFPPTVTIQESRTSFARFTDFFKRSKESGIL